jgi:excisionase family DNA binding protein
LYEKEKSVKIVVVNDETEDSIMNNTPENTMPEKWVNLEDIAVYLSMSEDTVRTWIKEGKLPYYRVGKRYKFKISEVDEWIRSGKMQG